MTALGPHDRSPLDRSDSKKIESDRIEGDRVPFKKSSSIKQAVVDFFRDLGRRMSSACGSFFEFKNPFSGLAGKIRRTDLPPSSGTPNHRGLAEKARDSVSRSSSRGMGNVTEKIPVQTTGQGGNSGEEEGGALEDIPLLDTEHLLNSIEVASKTRENLDASKSEIAANQHEGPVRDPSKTSDSSSSSSSKQMESPKAMDAVLQELQTTQSERRLSQGESSSSQDEHEVLQASENPTVKPSEDGLNQGNDVLEPSKPISEYNLLQEKQLETAHIAAGHQEASENEQHPNLDIPPDSEGRDVESQVGVAVESDLSPEAEVAKQVSGENQSPQDKASVLEERGPGSGLLSLGDSQEDSQALLDSNKVVESEQESNPVNEEISVKGEEVAAAELPSVDETRKKHIQVVSAYIEVYTMIEAAQKIVDQLVNDPSTIAFIQEVLGKESYSNFLQVQYLFGEQLKAVKEIKGLMLINKENVTAEQILMAAKCIRELRLTNQRFKGGLSHLSEMQARINRAVTTKEFQKKLTPEKKSLSDVISSNFIVLVKRVPQLLLPLKEILKNTPRTDLSYPLISEELVELTKIADSVNEGGRGAELFFTTTGSEEQEQRIQDIRSMLLPLKTFYEQNGLADAAKDAKIAVTLKQEWRVKNPIIAQITDYNELYNPPESLIVDAYLNIVMPKADEKPDPQQVVHLSIQQQLLKPRTKQQTVLWYAMALNLSDEGVKKAETVVKKLKGLDKINRGLTVDQSNQLIIFEDLLNTRKLLLKGKL